MKMDPEQSKKYKGKACSRKLIHPESIPWPGRVVRPQILYACNLGACVCHCLCLYVKESERVRTTKEAVKSQDKWKKMEKKAERSYNYKLSMKTHTINMKIDPKRSNKQ